MNNLEVRHNILSFLDIKNINNTLTTSKEYLFTFLQMHFWKEMFYRDYDPTNYINQYYISAYIPSNNDGWLKIYKYNTLKIKYKKHNIHI